MRHLTLKKMLVISDDSGYAHKQLKYDPDTVQLPSKVPSLSYLYIHFIEVKVKQTE